MKTIPDQIAELCPRSLRGEEMAALIHLCEAHETVAKNNPGASNQMVAYMGAAEVDLKSAFIGALSIIGGKHAPIAKIRSFIKKDPDQQELFLIFPGWGNSFHKKGIDPAIEKIEAFIENNFLGWHRRIEETTKLLHRETGKNIFPNIGCYTAVVAEIIGLPLGAELLLVVLPRLSTWTNHYLNALPGK